MGLHRKFTDEEIATYIGKETERFHYMLIRRLSALGDACVKVAREEPDRAHGGKSFTDQTGNLRSSIGYVLVNNGQIIMYSGFKQVKDGKKGKAAGYAYATELAKKHRKGLVLIVVAGMDYAAFVAARGCDVIQGAEAHANNHFQNAMNSVLDGFKK